MAKRVRFSYDDDTFEGIMCEVEDDSRLMLTDVKMTTAKGETVSYRPSFMFDMTKVRGIEELGDVEADAHSDRRQGFDNQFHA